MMQYYGCAVPDQFVVIDFQRLTSSVGIAALFACDREVRPDVVIADKQEIRALSVKALESPKHTVAHPFNMGWTLKIVPLYFGITLPSWHLISSTLFIRESES